MEKVSRIMNNTISQTPEIKSTSDALKYLYSLSLDSSSFRFRGQADFDWTLEPTIYRFNKFQRYQAVIFENFILEQKPKIPNPPLTHTTFDLEWLMVCQHYGVPTRLLDWTSDILTALFFSCSSEKEMNKDGVIFICDQNDYPRFAAYNEDARKTLDLAFINTNIVNPRVRIQSGCFMLWGSAPLDEQSTESYDLWQYHKKHINKHSLKKIRIPKEHKKSILLELEKIYSLTSDSLYIKNGYLEKKFLNLFKELTKNINLMTLYTTNSERLTEEENKIARSMFKIECKDMYGSCIRLGSK